MFWQRNECLLGNREKILRALRDYCHVCYTGKMFCSTSVFENFLLSPLRTWISKAMRTLVSSQHHTLSRSRTANIRKKHLSLHPKKGDMRTAMQLACALILSISYLLLFALVVSCFFLLSFGSLCLVFLVWFVSLVSFSVSTTISISAPS